MKTVMENSRVLENEDFFTEDELLSRVCRAASVFQV
jgi:hypothetical protein